MKTEGRDSREWWAYVDNAVIRVTGYTCAPENPGSWWCPSVGYTLNEGFQLFHREDVALGLAIRDAEREIVLANGRLARWKERLDSVQRTTTGICVR